MDPFFLAVIPGLLILASLAAMGIWMWRKKGSPETDYLMLFIVGAVWAVSGIIMSNFPLFALGTVFVLTGLTSRRKWKLQNKWKNMKADEKIMSAILLALSVAMVAFAFFSVR